MLWNALGVVFYIVLQVHGDSASFAASAKTLGVVASIRAPLGLGLPNSRLPCDDLVGAPAECKRVG